MKKVSQILVILTCFAGSAIAQEKKSLQVNGYVSSLGSVMFDSLTGSFTNDYILHNRLNIKGFIGEHITLSLEFRNRIFTGDMVEEDSKFAGMIGADPGLFDFSWNLMSEKSFIINSTLDRYSVDLNYGKFQVKIGRQRINWGQTIVWNPNDIFNTYSFFDFDYVERPGSDAIRLQYYPGSSSTIEFAVKADDRKKVTAAALYRFNKWSCDIQFLAGYVNGEDLVAGTGWSGSLGSISFRGEASWFQPARNFSDTAGRGLFTIGFDRSFNNNSMVQLQLMYCNDPLRIDNFNSLYSGNLSTKDLAFSHFTAFGQFSYPATPLLTLGVSAMWFPDLKGYFAGPSLDYSLAENLDLSVLWQHFYSRIGGEAIRINLGFLRVKYSF